MATVAAFGLVLSACGSDVSAPPTLPLDLGGRGAAAEDAAMGAMGAEPALAPDARWAPTTYEATPGLPTLGGDRPVHRLVPGSDEDLLRVGRALGISGEIVRDGDGRRIPAGDDAVLESWDGAWFSYWSGRAVDGGVAVACTPDGDCEQMPAPERPADLPTADQARSRVMAVLEAAGLSLEGAEVTVDDGITAWNVNVRYRVDGTLVDGLDAWASVDGSGITGISGPLGTLEQVGSYPTISAVDALDRLNEGWGPMPMIGVESTVDPVAPDVAEPPPADDPDAPPPDGAPAPDEPVGDEPTGRPVDPQPDPYVEPEPVVVTVTDVEWTLTTFWSWDGSGIYLLPAYRYTAEGQEFRPTVPAVSDDVIAPPPAVTDRPDTGTDEVDEDVEPMPPDEGAGGGTSGSSGSAPAVDAGTTEPDPGSR